MHGRTFSLYVKRNSDRVAWLLRFSSGQRCRSGILNDGRSPDFDLNRDNVVNIVDVQKVVAAAVGPGCIY